MNKIRVGLFGFGKTGRLVANEILHENSFELKWVIRRTPPQIDSYASTLLGLENKTARIYSTADINPEFYVQNMVDLIIDFSDSSGVNYYAEAAILHKIKVISAISKYTENDFNKLKQISGSTATLYSPNITIGVSILMVAAQVIQKILPNADIQIIEEHFSSKEEVSGTALKIASNLGLDIESQISSIRVGGIIGKHEVIFGLPNQTIRIKHESISKASFGQGAIFGANWLQNKSAGLYSMDQIIQDMFVSGTSSVKDEQESKQNFWKKVTQVWYLVKTKLHIT